MAKQKLPRIPKPKYTVEAVGGVGESSAQTVVTIKTPDLSHIAEALRPFAVPVSSLEFLPNNPRSHDENLNEIVASLKELGQYAPIIVNKRKTPPQVIAGNGRLQGGLSLGWDHMAAIFLDVDDATAAKIAIADNRTAELASWDEKGLEQYLTLVSITEGELAGMMATLAEEAKALQIPKIEEIPKKAPPKLTWVLLGIPVNQFGKVQTHVAALQRNAAITVQSNRDEN